MSKMRGCLENITAQELYNNRGFSALFGQTGETRKANTFRYLINHDQSNKVGSLNEKSRMYFLQKAEKAVQYSRQAEHLFCQIANSNNHQHHPTIEPLLPKLTSSKSLRMRIVLKKHWGERLHAEFLAINRDDQNIVELPAIDEILTSGWGVIPADLADECLKSSQARQEKVRQQKFNMVLPTQYDSFAI